MHVKTKTVFSNVSFWCRYMQITLFLFTRVKNYKSAIYLLAYGAWTEKLLCDTFTNIFHELYQILTAMEFLLVTIFNCNNLTFNIRKTVSISLYLRVCFNFTTDFHSSFLLPYAGVCTVE